MKKNENKSIISTIFTEKELAELNFTEEEIADIEEAELISRTADIVPSTEKELDAFYAKLDATFPPSADMVGTFEKFKNLATTDPTFLSQIVAMSTLVDTVEVAPESKTEKVNLNEIKNAKQKENFARINEMLKKLSK